MPHFLLGRIVSFTPHLETRAAKLQQKPTFYIPKHAGKYSSVSCHRQARDKEVEASP